MKKFMKSKLKIKPSLSFDKYNPADQCRRVFCLHVGNAGYYRQHGHGHIMCCGEETFAEGWGTIDHITWWNRDPQTGRFCKPFLTDEAGNWVSDDDLTAETGAIDFDGDYDRYMWRRVADMDDRELVAVWRWLQQYGCDATELLRDELKSQLLRWGIDVDINFPTWWE